MRHFSFSSLFPQQPVSGPLCMAVQVVSRLSGRWGLNQAHARLPGPPVCLPPRAETFPKLTKVPCALVVAWPASQDILRTKGTDTGFECNMYIFFPFFNLLETCKSTERNDIYKNKSPISQLERMRPFLLGQRLGQSPGLLMPPGDPVLHPSAVSWGPGAGALVAAVSFSAGAEPSTDPCV